jgi:hypothetical protein
MQDVKTNNKRTKDALPNATGQEEEEEEGKKSFITGLVAKLSKQGPHLPAIAVAVAL